MYTLLVADTSVLVREGLKSVLKNKLSASIVEVTEPRLLLPALKKHQPSVLIIDPVSMELSTGMVAQIKKQYKAHILAISNLLPRQDMSLFLNAGITSFLLKECDTEEIFEAIENTRKGSRFLCGKIVDHLVQENTEQDNKPAISPKISCDGVLISDRETEIIREIALGLSNKQIADKLCLSFHTVHTHRKNIMQKLHVNNTAGIVMFAVKNNLLVNEGMHTN